MQRAELGVMLVEQLLAQMRREQGVIAKPDVMIVERAHEQPSFSSRSSCCIESDRPVSALQTCAPRRLRMQVRSRKRIVSGDRPSSTHSVR